MNTSPLLILCTCPDPATAERIAQTVVSERLAACVNIVPGLTSIYRWQGQIEHQSELLLLIKTREAIYPLLETRIRELHPYETPEIISLSILAGSAPYLDWLADNTGAPL
ncbi:MAG: divalent-cation tolerance protein CutA [Synechococcaceae cyanobacterium SM1_2_3]|nr:divalent-cation tolerance protein CutA [Synechococcaceae cyanobacterium SM1_2_3]